MQTIDAPAPVRVGATADGSLCYLVDMAPAALPPVLKRDLEVAWQAANDHDGPARPDVARAFRFCRPDGSVTDLAVVDSDARSWASAVDRSIGLHTNYGLSLCLRLLALVEILARARSAARLLTVDRRQVRLHPSVLRAAACAPLDETGRFDEARFMTRVSEFLPGQGGIHALPAGACA